MGFLNFLCSKSAINFEQITVFWHAVTNFFLAFSTLDFFGKLLFVSNESIACSAVEVVWLPRVSIFKNYFLLKYSRFCDGILIYWLVLLLEEGSCEGNKLCCNGCYGSLFCVAHFENVCILSYL